MKTAGPVGLRVTSPAQVKSASNAAKEFAEALGFDTNEGTHQLNTRRHSPAIAG